ncbi:hypothetical protein Mal64_32130 [Pseudobythopirellula maris]|uniref:Uncharacterized protein n=1 Tax=Pseudobythopirellula maris TaxID=2527991 RepID=A0A5C5ZLH1_9BACT|nr:hypothetical protein Mal64_32130 [Pseudobythopirellula maris]
MGGRKRQTWPESFACVKHRDIIRGAGIWLSEFGAMTHKTKMI